MKNLVITNNELTKIVHADWQKFIIELAFYEVLLKKVPTFKATNKYKKELIENIKFISILKEDLTLINFKNQKLLDLNNNNFQNATQMITLNGIVWILIVTSIILPVSPLCIPLFIVTMFFATFCLFKNIKAIIPKLKNWFKKMKNKKLNYKNKHIKEIEMKKILKNNKAKQKDYTIWKNNYLQDIFNKKNQNESIDKNTITEINSILSENNKSTNKNSNLFKGMS